MTDYCLEAYRGMADVNTEAYYQEFMGLLTEMTLFSDAYRTGTVTLEDVEVSNDKKGTFAKIIDFIRRIVAKFMDTAKNLFKNNQEWFEANVHKFDTIQDANYAQIKITMVPYWNAKYDRVAPSIQPNDKRLGTDLKDSTAIEKAMYPSILKLTMSGNLTEGAKIYYRGKSNNAIAIEGAAVKDRVKKMINYCNEYVSTCNGIKEKIESVEKDIEKAQGGVDKAMESFIMVEGLPVYETVYATMPWVQNGETQYLVTEGKNSKKYKPSTTPDSSVVSTNTNNNPEASSTSSTTNTNDDKDKDKPQTTTVQNTADGEGANDAAKKEKDGKVASATAVRTYYQCMLKVDTAMMTIAEERYHVYLKTLRDILAASNVKPAEDKK